MPSSKAKKLHGCIHGVVKNTIVVIFVANNALNPLVMIMKQQVLEQTVWSKIKVLSSQECWVWQQGTNAAGYGVVKIQGRSWLAHRLIYRLATGRAPSLHVLHSCDNPPCCNPSHLREGTQADNMRDMSERGRATGVPPINSVLNEYQVRVIRRVGDVSHKTLARYFEVSRGTIQHIRTGRTWKTKNA